MIVAALYFSLRSKKWEKTEEEAGAGSSDEVGIAAEQSVEKAP